MTTLTIDRDLCAKDGICVAECPIGLYEQDTQGIAVLAENAEEACINCGHCLTVCPTGAITVNGVAQSECDHVQREFLPEGQAVQHYFRTRRSIRSFKQQPVPRETLEQLVDLTRWAPSARNGQPVEWTLAADRETIQDLARYVAAWVRESGTYPRLADAFEAGRDLILRDAPALAIVHARTDAILPEQDCCIALTTMEMAAPSFGLGACWAGLLFGASRFYPPIRERLHIPDGQEVQGALMLGYPRFFYSHIPPREPSTIEWLESD